MTEARHDQAVALLTGTSPTITLLVERDQASAGGASPRTRPHSPPPPEPSDSPEQEEGDEHLGNHLNCPMEDEYPIEEVTLIKAGGPLGLSIVGGSDHASHPFGINEPGVFISKVIPNGLASQSGLRVGDRILEVNTIDLRHATHQEAVRALLSNKQEIRMLVRRDPSPPGMQEIVIHKLPGEKLGISIRGGAKGHAGNPFDPTDEGIFISKVSSSGAAARDGRLRVGMRILEVGNNSLLGMTHTEAVRVLRASGDSLVILVCDGFDPRNAASIEASPGVIANPFAAGIVRKNSMESISSVDRDMSPEEIDIMQKEVEMVRETSQWEREEMEKVNLSTGPLKLDYKTLAALPTTSLQKVNRFSPSFATFFTMEAAMSASPIDPLGFEKVHASMYHVEPVALPSSPVCPATSSAGSKPPQADTWDPLPALGVPQEAKEEEENLVDSQPICFSENPFLVANRKSKGRPPEERILSGPPVGYGRHGQLQPWLYSKSSPSEPHRIDSPVRDAAHSPHNSQQSHKSSSAMLGREVRYSNIHFPSNASTKDNSSTKPGAIQPLSRVRPAVSPASQDGHSSPNPFQHGLSPINSQTTPRAPSPDTHEEYPINIKQVYKAFAAVPHSLAVLEPPQDLYSPRNNVSPMQPSPETPTPTNLGRDSPEQRSFRDRQKYFEIDVKQQTPDKPKPRISLVGEDDLKKMKEEEAKRMEQRAQEYMLDEDEDDEEEDLAKQVADMKARGKVILDGVEYKVESLGSRSSPSPRQCATPPSHCGSSGPSSVDGKGDSQRNSMEDSFRLEQRPNSMTGLIPVYPGESVAPIRTAKAERRHQDRLRMQSPELAVAMDKELSPAEKRALEAEKRAMWRAARPYGLEEDVRQYEQDLAKRLYQSRVRASLGSAAAPPTSCSSSSCQPRMKSLEQDALKAQMVIAKSKEGKKRGTLDQLSESPSPAPTPSPTPMEDFSPRAVTSPGRLSLSEKKFDYRQFAAIPSSKPVYDIQSPGAGDDVRFMDDASSNPGDFLG